MFPEKTKILVVDDFKTMRKLVTSCLKKLNLNNFMEADDGSTAWAAVEEALLKGDPFELIIADWNMPNMPGIEFLKRVRENPKTANLPFILLTAEAEQAKILEAIKYQVTSYIVKPFNPGTLTQKLEATYQKLVPSK